MLNIHDIMRCSGVDRWQIIPTIRKQNLAEHSFMVAMIADDLAKNILEDHNQLALIMAALTHDLTEQMTGDIATPVKERIKATAGDDIFDKIDQEIDPNIYQMRHNLRAEEKIILKLADLIDAVRFLSDEAYTKHGKMVLENIRIRIENMIIEANNKYSGDWLYVPRVLSKMSIVDPATLKFEIAGWGGVK